MIHARLDYQGRIVDTANLIPENEPVFLLRGQDKLVPQILRYYVELTRSESESDDAANIADLVENHIYHIETWQEEHISKYADL